MKSERTGIMCEFFKWGERRTAPRCRHVTYGSAGRTDAGPNPNAIVIERIDEVFNRKEIEENNIMRKFSCQNSTRDVFVGGSSLFMERFNKNFRRCNAWRLGRR